MWAWLWAKLLSNIFGEGLGADIAGRGAVYLVGEARKAIDADEVRLTSVRLRPGERYTVIARPPATRRERQLASAQRHLRDRDRRLSRPGRAQLRAARRLSSTQRRLDRRRPGTRRYDRLARREEAQGRAFDRVMRPTRRQRAVRSELERVERELTASRDARFEAVARSRGLRRRAERTRVYE